MEDDVFMRNWLQALPSLLVLATIGCSTGSGKGIDGFADAGGEFASAEIPDDFGPLDVGETESIAPEPLYEKGLIAPVDSIPCFHHGSGQEAQDCNHHGSSVSVQPDGTVLAVWYHGVAEKSKDSRILISRRPAGGGWSLPEVLFDDPDFAEGNPVIWVREDGELYLFFVTILGENWPDAEVRLITSADSGVSWSPVKVLRKEWNWMVRNHPLRLSTGELLLPCYDEKFYSSSFMYSADDFGADWEESVVDGEWLFEHLSQIQPSVIEREDGTLYALLRNTSNGLPRTAWQMTSGDMGRTWSPQSPSEVPNDDNSLEMLELASGRVMVVFNNTPSGRFPLAGALSDDEARTWSAVATLNDDCEGTGCSYGYPSLAQDPTDGSVWVTYTHNRGSIGWVHVNEPWMLQQKDAFAL